MKNSIEPLLASQLAALVERRSGLKLPFLVTLVPGAKPGSVVPFVPTQEVDTIRMVAGEMTASQALELAAHPKVERIEYDGQAHALAQLLDGT